ncbi:MAG: 50S ribosomal protein L3 N(5)-glutamine methyltransferase [Sinobacteraceae bacterium]|nr:50S ribosomal protein L3 N(5)-glutamine methyltransferase [Nevskiaceae bacterium]
MQRRAPRTDARGATVGALVREGARRFERAGLFYGHGTDNAHDEAAALVLHGAKLGALRDPKIFARRLSARAARHIGKLFERRIRERIPAVYLTGETWFAGLPFSVDSRVLIPRSAIAELIEARFQPWIAPERVKRILDMGTGSGCIAIACARAFPGARVDAVDISAAALEVARLNVRRHRLNRRVELIESDHFNSLPTPRARRRYDIIVSNPPYVGTRELQRLPAEYRHEPRIALAAGASGLDSVRVLLQEAVRFLQPYGLLVVEVGNTERATRRAFPHLPFLWLHFQRGGGGVFMLTREQLQTG